MVRINDNLFPEPVIIKTPSEVVNVDFDFVDEIPSSDSIKAVGSSSATKVIATDTNGADVSNSLVLGYLITATTKVRGKITAGTDGANYLITATAEMGTSGEKFQKFKKIKVRAAAYL